MNKYSVKNCPVISFVGGCQNKEVKVWDCQDCTDCLLKQIVGLCKEVENIENVKTLYDAAKSGMFLQANRILKLLDIQECE